MSLTEEQRATRAAFLEQVEPQIIPVLHAGRMIEVRQPTLGERGWIYEHATELVDGKVKFNFSALQVRAVIACACYPGTTRRVFAEPEAPELLRQLAGGAIDRLAVAALKLLNVDGAGIDRLVGRLLRRGKK